MRRAAHPRLEFGQPGGIPLDEIRIVGNVADEAQAGGAQILEPFVFRRAVKLHQAQPFAGENPDGPTRGLSRWCGRVNGSCGEAQQVKLGPRQGPRPGGARQGRRLEQLVRAVISHQPGALAPQSFGGGGITRLNFQPRVRFTGRGGGKVSAENNQRGGQPQDRPATRIRQRRISEFPEAHGRARQFPHGCYKCKNWPARWIPPPVYASAAACSDGRRAAPRPAGRPG